MATAVNIGAESALLARTLRWAYRVQYTSESATSLAVFRIAFSTALLLQVADDVAFRDLSFPTIPSPVFGAWMLVILALLIGFKARAAGAISYLFAVVIYGRLAVQAESHWAADAPVLTGSLILAFAASGNALSVDRWLDRRRGIPPSGVTPLPGILLGLTVGLMYLDSVLWKLDSQLWTNGLGAWAPATSPWAVWWDVSPLLASEPLLRMAGYTTLAVEATFVFLVWTRLRLLMLCLAAILHVGILVLYPIPLFSLVMLAFLAGLAPVTAYGRTDRAASLGGGRIGTMRTVLWCGAIMVWIGSAAIVMTGNPLVQPRLPTTAGLTWLANQFAWRGFTFTGFKSGALFLDGHFLAQATQTALVWRDGDGGETFVPMSNADGRAGPYSSNRRFSMWWQATRSGQTEHRLAAGLERFATAWVQTNRINLRSGTLLIKQRPIEVVIDAWQPDVLRRNLDRPWRDVGTIEEEPEGLKARFGPGAQF